MKKITVKFPHTHEGVSYPAGSILELPEKTADWLCSQKIEDQPCAVPYTGNSQPINTQPKKSEI